MHSNTKRLGTFVLGSVLTALILAAPSALADTVTLTITPNSLTDYSATAGGTAVVFTDNAADIDSGSEVIITATPKTSSIYKFATAPTDWTLADPSVTYTIASFSAAQTVEIPTPSDAKTAAEVWPTGSGDGTSDNPYQITSEDNLIALKDWVAADKETSGVYFKQMNDITMTKVWAGIGNNWGLKSGVLSPGYAVGLEQSFRGTYDGQNKTISNVVFAKYNYMGFFTYACGATIKNLTVEVAGFDPDSSTADFGGAAIVGCLQGEGGVLYNLTAKGSFNESLTHTGAGIAVKIGLKSTAGAAGATGESVFLVESCTNRIDITTTASKVGGLVGFCQRQDTAATYPVHFENCSNEGDLHGVPTSNSSGVGGFVAWINDVVEFTNCSSTGSCVADNGKGQYACSYVGANNDKAGYQARSLTGNTTTLMDNMSVYCTAAAVGFGFATVADSVATFVTPEADGETVYRVMLTNAVATLTAIDQSIILDESFAPASVGQSLGANYTVTSSGETASKTYTCAIATPIAVTITVSSPAFTTYTVKDGDIALPVSENTVQVPSGVDTTIAATIADDYEIVGYAAAGWEKNGQVYTKTINVTEAAAVTIPAATLIPPAVAVAENRGYTNLVFTIKDAEVATYTVTVKDISGNTVGTAVSKSIESGDTFEIAANEFGDAFVPGQTYNYVVTKGDDAVGKMVYADVSFDTDTYFGASVAASAETLVNGTWTVDKPDIGTDSYSIDSTQSVFSVTTIKTNDLRKVIQIDAELTVSDYYYLDDLLEDIPSAIAGVALVTNEENAADVSWRALVGGSTWTALTGPYTTLDAYTTRMEIDYNDAEAPTVRYSVKRTGTDAWKALADSNGVEWFAAQPNALSVSNVCFSGKAELAGFSAKLSSEGVANVGGIDGTDYATIAEGLTAVKDDSDKTLVLYTNIQIDPKDLAVGTYKLDKQGAYTFTVLDRDWTIADGQATVASGDETLTVTKQDFAAKIGYTDNALAFLTLADAFAKVDDDDEVVVLKDIAESTSVDKDITLNVNDKVITLGSGETTKPVLKIDGAAVVISNGYFEGAPAGQAAISLVENATVEISNLAVTNTLQNATAFAAESGSTVAISNGLFTGAFSGAGIYNIAGGYFLANADQTMSFAGTVSATGGKFTDVSATALPATAIADTDKMAELALSFTTNGFTITKEIMKRVYDPDTPSTELETKVWTVQEDTGAEKTVGGVQIPDDYVTTTVMGGSEAWKSDPTTAQTKLNESAQYKGAAGTATMKNWEAYVLGVDSSTSEGPVVKGVQDTNTGKIGFQIASPTAIRAAQSGCDVKFSVTPCTSPTLSGEGTESDKVDYNGTLNVDVPDDGKVRYYKLKMYISPKN